MARKVAYWRFPTEAAMNLVDHTNFGVIDGDVCTVDDGFNVFHYVEADTAWQHYPAPSSAHASASNAAGSTNTLIRRWTNTSVVGSAFTWNASATLGDSISVGRAGIYSLTLTWLSAGLGTNVGLNVGPTLTNTFLGTYLRGATTAAVGKTYCVPWTGKVEAGDNIWVSTSTASVAGGTSTTDFLLEVAHWGEF
jgi:hypothetical protein